MKILLLGSTGQLGWELGRSLAPLGALCTPARDEADLCDPAGLRELFGRYRPEVVVNAAAYTGVDQAEREPDLAACVNARAVAILADEARRSDAVLVHYSTDYVFDGDKPGPYVEDDVAVPINAYGRSKLLGEEAIRASSAAHLIFRISWLYSPRRSNFARTMLQLAATRDVLRVVDDQAGAPTSAELVADCTAHALRRCIEAPRTGAPFGTYHLCAAGRTTWYAYARALINRARASGHPIRVCNENVVPIKSAEYPAAARRPANSLLDTNRLRTTFGLTLPDWQVGLDRFVEEIAMHKGDS